MGELGPIEGDVKRRRLPGWAWGLAAGLAVIVLSIPLYVWLTGDSQDVANTVPTTDATSLAHAMTFDLSERELHGTGWLANTEITGSMPGIPNPILSTVSDATGSFSLGPFEGCCDRMLTVSDGQTTLSVEIPWSVTIWRVDPASDVVAGTVNDSREIDIRITGGPELYETVVTPVSGNWLLELAGIFDILPGMTVRASVVTPDITFTTSSGTLIDTGLDVFLSRGLVSGGGWVPKAVLSVAIDGALVDNGVVTDTAGFFSVSVDLYGLELLPGSVLTVGDGTSEVRVTIPKLTFETLDPLAGVASGTTNVPDGTVVSLAIELGPIGDGAQDEQRFFDITVVGGEWQLEFEPPPQGREVLAAWVSDFERGAVFQVDFDMG